MKIKTYTLLLLAAGILTSTASAKPEDGKGEKGDRPNPAEHFAEQDTNGDGYLSLEEVQASQRSRMAEHFETLDTDGDGLLSKEELKEGRKMMRDKMKEMRGPDGEGEKGDRPDPKKMFEKMDADQSGGISKSEAKGPMAKAFDKIDTDGDGELTPDEMKAFHEQMRGKHKEKKFEE